MSTTVVAWAHAVNFADPLTTTVNVGSDADRVAYVLIGVFNNTGPLPVGVTVGANALTAASAQFNDTGGWKWRLYAGALTVTGSQTVSADFSSNFGFSCMVGLVESGVDTATVVESVLTDAAAVSTRQPGFTITSAAGDKAAMLFFSDDTRTFTPGSGTVELSGTGLPAPGATGTPRALTESGAASVVIGGTLGGAVTAWRGAGFNIPNASAPDTTPPTLTGSITIGTVTSTSIQMSWPAGSDNVAVTSYEVSSNGGSSYSDVGNVLTHTFTGLTPSTSYGLRVRAKDAAGNVSTPALSATQSTNSSSPTTATLSGPSSGTTGSPSTNFTVTLDAAATSTVTVTPAGTNGTVTFSPSSPSIGVGQTSVTFTANAALDGLHNISITTSPSLTIAGSPVAYTTSSLAGFDLHTDPYIFGDLAGGLTGLTREASIGVTVAVYAIDTTTVPGAKIPGSKLWQSGILNTDSNGKLTRQTNAAFTAGTEYMLLFVRQSDGQTCAVTSAAT